MKTPAALFFSSDGCSEPIQIHVSPLCKRNLLVESIQKQFHPSKAGSELRRSFATGGTGLPVAAGSTAQNARLRHHPLIHPSQPGKVWLLHHFSQPITAAHLTGSEGKTGGAIVTAYMVAVRDVQPRDYPSIRTIHSRAFGQELVADLVDQLRGHGQVLLSLVAISAGHPVGHILYSRMLISGVAGAGLGPLAVQPEYQRQGIGSQLVRTGNDRLKNLGCPFVIVIGHPWFYPRFGFQPAARRGITCACPVPDECFMLLVLDEARLRGLTGVVDYGLNDHLVENGLSV